jgi:hypothetical protein
MEDSVDGEVRSIRRIWKNSDKVVSTRMEDQDSTVVDGEVEEAEDTAEEGTALDVVEEEVSGVGHSNLSSNFCILLLSLFLSFFS